LGIKQGSLGDDKHSFKIGLFHIFVHLWTTIVRSTTLTLKHFVACKCPRKTW
jgi:hypothetical protein